jgi:hypothetical protein
MNIDRDTIYYSPPPPKPPYCAARHAAATSLSRFEFDDITSSSPISRRHQPLHYAKKLILLAIAKRID